MMRTTTPFKIHDENAGVSIKPAKSGGLKPSTDGPPQKKGLQSGVKSTRKGLSNLTASQINTRLATPAHSINMKAKLSTTVKETQKVKFKVAEDYYVNDFQPEEMHCTRLCAEVDYFDMSIRGNPAHMPEIDVGDTSWMNVPASPRRSEEPSFGFDLGDYDLEEPDHLQHFHALSNAPLMDLSGYDD